MGDGIEPCKAQEMAERNIGTEMRNRSDIKESGRNRGGHNNRKYRNGKHADRKHPKG